MFPLLINTIPGNGSENVNLDQAIRLEFSGDLSTDLTLADIRLIDMNRDQEVTGITATVEDASLSFLDISIPAEATGGHKYEGHTQYKLLVSSLRSATEEAIGGIIELRFTTEPGDISNYISDDTLVLETGFRVIRSHPKADSVGTPIIIRLKFSSEIDPMSDLTHIILVKGQTIEDALFMGESTLIAIEDIGISSDIMTIQCPSLDPATDYTLSVSGLQDTIGEIMEPYNISFTSSFESMYAQISDIFDSNAVMALMKDASEITIAGLISNNGKLAEFIAQSYGNEDIDWENPPLYVYSYVKYKTQYDILFDKFIQLSGNPTSKQLKDLTIEYGYSLADILKLVDKLALRFKYWEDLLKGASAGKARPAAFQRGSGVDEDPEFKNRKFRDREGAKEW